MKKLLSILLTLVMMLSMCTGITASAASAGWQKNSKGWWYQTSSGKSYANTWAKIGGKWYLFNKNGYMCTGWQKSGGKWYLLSSSGAMCTGWVKTGGKWYLLSNSGAMCTGWAFSNGNWYYMDASGAMVTNTTISGWKIGSDGVAKNVRDGQLLEDGINYYNNGRYKQSLDCLYQIYAGSEQYSTAQNWITKATNKYRDEVLDEANSYIADGDYEEAYEIWIDARKYLENDSQARRAFENAKEDFKAIMFDEADELYEEEGCEEAIRHLKEYWLVFNNDEDYLDELSYYESRKPTHLYELEEYDENVSWALSHNYTGEDALGNVYSNVYQNTGDNLWLAPGAAWGEFYIKSAYSKLIGSVAFASSSGDGYLEVFSDREIIYTSPLVNGRMGAIDFEVDITGVDFLALQVQSGEDSDWDCNDVLLIDVQLIP